VVRRPKGPHNGLLKWKTNDRISSEFQSGLAGGKNGRCALKRPRFCAGRAFHFLRQKKRLRNEKKKKNLSPQNKKKKNLFPPVFSVAPIAGDLRGPPKKGCFGAPGSSPKSGRPRGAPVYGTTHRCGGLTLAQNWPQSEWGPMGEKISPNSCSPPTPSLSFSFWAGFIEGLGQLNGFFSFWFGVSFGLLSSFFPTPFPQKKTRGGPEWVSPCRGTKKK